ncbi:Cathepsin G [Galemys pyrenaicus]|uniref:Cathepsin G n=1 Tax=Galemys pyrenaicus TaxID=202257 RepID=A0A8J6DHM0_GALPY|nr:Cathepsin G [Galemys pyrenaicus]
MQPLLLLLAFLLPPGAGTEPSQPRIFQSFLSEEIIGGREVKPHSRPYMAFVRVLATERTWRCGGVLVQRDFVLTAAHCWGRSITVTLGAHNITKQERTQQVIKVKRAIPHPAYNPRMHINDIMLLQLERKAKKTKYVKPLSLPRHKARVKPGQVCSVAGWGQDQQRNLVDTLQEVQLRVQEDEECESRFPKNYIRQTQICAGDPKEKKASFKVRIPASMQLLLFLVALLLPPRTEAENTEINARCFLPGKIIGGREARPHAHPYMAYLQIQTPVLPTTCGGFLVREDFVLTAAHCQGSSITVKLGAHNIRRQERTQQSIGVRRAFRHPGYDPQNNQNDIMLLQLQRRARKTRAVRTLGLPQSQGRLRPGTQCMVAGWGLVSLNRRTEKLQEAQLRVQQDRACSRRFRTYNSQTQICVGSSRERKSVFKGDSGGPLVCNGVGWGIVSYGNDVGTPPAVFTRVSSFIPWIKRTMRRFKQSD